MITRADLTRTSTIVCLGAVFSGMALSISIMMWVWLLLCQRQEHYSFTGLLSRAIRCFLSDAPASLVGALLWFVPAIAIYLYPPGWLVVVGFYAVIGCALTLYLFQLCALRKQL
ncbi:hypothetical protein [Corynebacterium sp. sy039]|uniref:hypothetical protein n=1 Tax=Corynebacterium sp. sy039 TaxID=2599641 RepID=UPI0011B78FCC|nr:hypothetical protein [Corynebacterium sp. sy039]QDZ43054.1 hypothetical protein FQV43_07675 [Corynebacterium sp. sy039]